MSVPAPVDGEDLDSWISSDFEHLLGQRLTPEGRERLYRIKDKFDLKRSDFWWKFFFVLEHYETLYEKIPSEIATVGNSLVAELKTIKSEVSDQVLKDARKLYADEKTLRETFTAEDLQKHKTALTEMTAANKAILDTAFAEAVARVEANSTKVILSSINGELQKMTKSAGDRRVEEEIRNAPDWFEMFVFVLYSISATWFVAWGAFSTTHVNVVFTAIAIVVGIAIWLITLGKPEFAKLTKRR